jgi:hypothetical protein
VASIAVTLADNSFGMTNASFQMDEESMKRIYKAYQFMHKESKGFYSPGKIMDEPQLLSVKEILDKLSETFMSNLFMTVYEAEKREALLKLNIKYIELTGRT